MASSFGTLVYGTIQRSITSGRVNIIDGPDVIDCCMVPYDVGDTF